jgi:DNA-binding Lrp family transcriptional regulator
MAVATEHTDELNAQILAISEDRIQGFHPEPFQKISELSGFEEKIVLDRIRAMLEAGTIRRVRQTLLSTNLANGALVAWKIPQAKLDDAFDFLFNEDPFSGHVVIRSTDSETAGSEYKLWTTLKTPQGIQLSEHTHLLAPIIGAEKVKLMPAKGIFTLGVGHVRRKTVEPGAKADAPAQMLKTGIVELNDLEWRVLHSLKREFTPDEIRSNPWAARAQEADLPFRTFCEIAENLTRRKIIGRFSTFLEHVKPSASGTRVTKFNALFHWAVPPGMEEKAGSEVGRHEILTHCYWREAGAEFKNVNIMAVAHGTDKNRLLEHKAAIDEHLECQKIPVSYTNVFWGGRSEIKPSEISPFIYAKWRKQHPVA